MRAEQCKITIFGIAAMTGQKVSTIRRHRKEGLFGLKRPESVISYVMAQMLMRGLRNSRETHDGGIND